LRHESDFSQQASVGDGYAAHTDRPAVRRDRPDQQPDSGGLAGSGRAEQADCFT